MRILIATPEQSAISWGTECTVKWNLKFWRPQSDVKIHFEEVSDCKKRWKHFRDHYRKKVKDDSGTGQTKTKNTWEYMSQLNFLSEVPFERKIITNLETSSNKQTEDAANVKSEPNLLEGTYQVTEKSREPDTDNKGEQSRNSETNERTSGKKRKCDSSVVESLQKIQRNRSPVNEKLLSAPERTHIQKFFESMGDVVSQFPPDLAAETRLKVCQIVTEMELKMFSGSASPSGTRTTSFSAGPEPVSTLLLSDDSTSLSLP